MQRALRASLTALLVCGLVGSMAAADELKAGDRAPDFTLPGTDGQTHDLSQLKGRWVVLAWFPKAFTGG